MRITTMIDRHDIILMFQMTVINIYRYNQYKNLEESLNFDKKTVKCLLIELIAGLLNAFLLPVYTYKESDNILQYFALPASTYDKSYL